MNITTNKMHTRSGSLTPFVRELSLRLRRMSRRLSTSSTVKAVFTPKRGEIQ